MCEGMYEYCEERRRLSVDFKITGYILCIYRVRWDTVLVLLYPYLTLTLLNDYPYPRLVLGIFGGCKGTKKAVK